MFAFLFVFCALSALLGQEDTLSDSLNMRLVGVWEAPMSLPIGSSAHTLDVQDSFVYIYTGTETLYVLNISRPDSPYVFARYIGTDWGAGVFVDDTVLCVSESGSLRFINVSDPQNPITISSLAYDGGLVRGFALSSGLVFTGLRRWSVVDVSDLLSPYVAVAGLDSLLSSYFSSTTELWPASLSDVYLHLGGHRLEWDSVLGYWWEYGEYYCFNISTPTDPSLVRYIDLGLGNVVYALEGIGNIGFIGTHAYRPDTAFFVSTCTNIQTLLEYDRIDHLSYADGFLVVIGCPDLHCESDGIISVWDVSRPCSLKLVGYYKSWLLSPEVFRRNDTVYIAGVDYPNEIRIYAAPIGTLGIQGGLNSFDNFNLHPNPVFRGTPVYANKQGVVYDICGRNIITVDSKGIIDTSKLKPGLYIVLPRNGKPKKLLVVG